MKITYKPHLLTLHAQAEYVKWVHDDLRSFAEVIRDVKSLTPDVGHLMEMLPKLQCRYYSISSSPKAEPSRYGCF